MKSRELKGYQIENVRGAVTPELEEAVVRLWLDEKILPEAEARQRIRQLLLVAREQESGKIAGVSTTYLETQPVLRMPLWYMRIFVPAVHRESKIAFHLTCQSLDYHHQRFVSGEDTSGRGFYTEVENPFLKKYRNEAVWSTTGMAFVGLNARGDHCRVRYFDGATIS